MAVATTKCRRFEGSVAVVTGSAQGIGRATALRLGAEGASVVVADRAEAQAREVVAELRELGVSSELVVVDLEHWQGALELSERTLEVFGRIDVAINNVGGTIWAKPFYEYPIEQIEREVQRSLWPTLWCCRAFIPHMIERRAGSIVNVGSVATRGINRVPYSACKGGVHAVTVCLAMELAEFGIRVNCVAPGGVNVGERAIPRAPEPYTPEENGWMGEVVDQTLRDTPLKRFGRPEELAATIAFVASPDASYITGEVIDASGGLPGRV